MQTGTFNTFDGQALYYRSWKNGTTVNGKILFLLHSGNEHSLRLNDIAENSAFEAYTVYSFDNRGHGKTEIEDTFEFMNLVRDLNAFAAFVCIKEKKKMEDIFVIANSTGGVTAATWMHDYAPRISGMALIAPAFEMKLYMPFAKGLLDLVLRFKPKMNITSYIKSKFLTHDLNEQKKYKNDSLITRSMPAKQLSTLLDTGKRVVADAAMIKVPTIILSAEKDYIVNSKVQGDFYASLSSPLKKFVEFEEFYHGILYEQNAQLAIDEIAIFIEKAFSYKSTDGVDKLINITQQQSDKINYGSLPFFTKASYVTQRILMKRLGFLSKGIQAGLTYGFDSDVACEHIHKNKAEGVGHIGKWIDKNYLNSLVWEGIRERKINLIFNIEQKIATLQATGKTVNILDIAGGSAKYLIEVANKYPDITIQVRDNQMQNVLQGQNLAAERRLKNITYIETDAFDANSYSDDDFQPNIVIISGVFEQFPENNLIINAIKGVTSIIQNQGYLLYTGQPWQPQFERIVNVLRKHKKSKRITRRRSQDELDDLFFQFGFHKDNMQLDNWGQFTVSSALFQRPVKIKKKSQ